MSFCFKNKWNNLYLSGKPLNTMKWAWCLDSYQIWIIFNWEWNEEWPQELQAGFISNLITFELRINQRMASRAPSWIHIKFDHFSIKNKLKNSLKSPKLDSYEIWSFFNWEWIKEWPQELLAGFIWNLIIS